MLGSGEVCEEVGRYPWVVLGFFSNHLSFEYFKTISLCNCIYNIVEKVIVRRVKDLFSKSISGEYFRLLVLNFHMLS